VVSGPSVAIVIPNWNGARHLPDCLNSLEALDYPRDLLEVIVVDNGSTDASLELLREHYPLVRVIAHSENVGFAAASNSGASATDAECVAFLNNDMRVDRLWLRELVGAYEPETGYVCVAGVILTWDGSQIDFVDGRINFHGAPSQEHLDLDLDESLIEDGRELPFPCGGSMLISRQVFLDVGAFDPAFFAYCEDVDLGWRLWVLGYKVRLAARSRCFHRRHGTGSTVPFYQRLVLYERNSLLSLVKNVSDENFAPLLTAALFLTIERTLVRGRSDRASYDVGAADGDELEELPRAALAGLHGVSDILGDLEGVLDKRSEIQRQRKRSDAEVFALFRRPFAPVFKDERYLQASIQLRAVLGLDKLFHRQRATHMLIVARTDSERLRAVARSAAELTQVVFASSVRTPTLPGVTVTPIRSREHLADLLAEADLVVVDGTTDHGDLLAERTPGLLVVDVTDPIVSDELLGRADVVVCGPETVPRSAFDPGGGKPNVLERLDNASLIRHVRAMIQQPWEWQRHGNQSRELVLPEDLRMLLARSRTRTGTNGRATARVPRVVWARMPETVQRAVLKVLRR
jgi:GT2 family glycosyltransferase